MLAAGQGAGDPPAQGGRIGAGGGVGIEPEEGGRLIAERRRVGEPGGKEPEAGVDLLDLGRVGFFRAEDLGQGAQPVGVGWAGGGERSQGLEAGVG